MVAYNKYASSGLDAAAKTINGGTDLELGDWFWSPAANGGKGDLNAAVTQAKTVTEKRVDESVSRVLYLRMVTGQFDPIEDQPYTKIGAEAVNSTAAQQLNLEAALQSFVLLKNDARKGVPSGGALDSSAAVPVLPFTKGKKTAILGPHVFSTRDLMSDYKGDEQCAGGSSDWTCFPTIAQAFTRANGASATVVEQGVELAGNKTDGIAAALAAAAGAEQVLIFIGIGNTQEHEGIDRHDTSLPGLQESFTLQVLAQCQKQGIPAAVVMINGGALAIDPIVPAASAIVEAFYPSVRGAHALTMAMFGDDGGNRWGKLPVTMYDKEYITKADFHSFAMSASPGRTYKYYTGTPLFTFGTGLSYSQFDVSCAAAASTNTGSTGSKNSADTGTSTSTTIKCSVAVSGGAAVGEEVLMAFHSVSESIRSAAKHPVPLKELVAFDRVQATAATPATVQFEIGPNQLGLVDEDGNRQLVKGQHSIQITNGAGYSQHFPIVVAESKVLVTVPRMPARG
jgi:hypothetical protein